LSHNQHTEQEFQQLLQALFVEKKKVKELQKKIQEIGQERVDLREQIELLNNEKQTLVEKSLQLQTAAVAQPALVGAGEIVDAFGLSDHQLDDQLTQLQERLQDAPTHSELDSSELDNLKDNLALLNDQIEAKQTICEQLEEQLQESQKVVTFLGEQVENCQTTITYLEGIVLKEKEDYATQLAAIVQQKRVLEQDLDKYKRMAAILDRKYQDVTGEAADLDLNADITVKSFPIPQVASYQFHLLAQSSLENGYSTLPLAKIKHLQSPDSLRRNFITTSEGSKELEEKIAQIDEVLDSLDIEDVKKAALKQQIETAVYNLQRIKKELGLKVVNLEATLEEEKAAYIDAHKAWEFEQRQGIELREQLEDTCCKLSLLKEDFEHVCKNLDEQKALNFLKEQELARQEISLDGKNDSFEQLQYKLQEKEHELKEKEAIVKHLSQQIEDFQNELSSAQSIIQTYTSDYQKLLTVFEQSNQDKTILSKHLEIGAEAYRQVKEWAESQLTLSHNENTALKTIAFSLKHKYQKSLIVQQQQKDTLVKQQKQFFEVTNQLNRANKELKETVHLLSVVQGENHVLKTRYQESKDLFKKIFNANRQRVANIKAQLAENQVTFKNEQELLVKEQLQIQHKFSKLLNIATKLKEKYLSALTSQQRDNKIANQQRSLAQETLSKLNCANQALKTISTLLEQEKLSHAAIVTEFAQEKEKVITLQKEVEQKDHKLKGIKQELLDMGSAAINEDFSKDQTNQTKDVRQLAIELRSALIAKMATCDQLSEKLKGLEEENITLKEKENTLKAATKKFYVELKKLKASQSEMQQPLIQENETLRREYNLLRDGMLSLQDKLQTTQSELTSAYEQLESAKSAYYGMEEKNNHWKRYTVEAEQKISQLQQDLSETIREFKENKDTLNALQFSYNMLEKQKEELTVIEKDLKQKLEMVQGQLEGAQRELELKGDTLVLHQTISHLESAHERAQHEIQELKSQKMLLAKQAFDLQGKIASLQQELHANKELLDATQFKYQEIHNELLITSREKEQLQQRLTEIEANAQNDFNRIAELQTVCHKLEVENQELRQILADDKLQIEKLARQLGDLEHQYALVESEKEIAVSTNNQLKQEVDTLRFEWADLQNKLKIADTELTQLKDEYHALTSQKVQADEAIAQDCTIIDDLHERVKKATEQQQELQEALDKVQGDYNALQQKYLSEKGHIAVELEQTHKELNQAKVYFNQSQDELNLLRASYNRLREENTTLKLQDQKLQEILNNTQDTLQSKQARLVELQAKLEVAYAQAQVLREEADTLKNTHDEVLKEQGQWHIAYETAQQQIIEKNNEIERLTADFNVLQQEYIEIQQNMGRYLNQIETLEQQLVQADKQAQEAQAQITEVNTYRNRLQQDLEFNRSVTKQTEERAQHIKQQYDELQVEYTSVSQNCDNLRVELEQTQQLKQQALDLLSQTQQALLQAKSAQDEWKKERELWDTLGTFEECHAMKLRLGELQSELQIAHTNHASLQDEYANVQLQIERSDKELEILSSLLESTKNEFLNSQHQYATLHREHELLNHNHHALQERLQALQNLLLTKEEKIAQNQQERESLLKLIDDLTAAKYALRKEIEDLQNSNQDVALAHSVEIETLQQAKQQLEAQLVERTKELENLSQEIQSIKQLLTQGVKEAKEIEKQYLVSVKEKAQIQAQLQQSNELLIRYQKEIQTLQFQAESKENTQYQSFKRIEELDTLLKKSQNEQAEIQAKLTQAEQSFELATQERISLKKDLQAARQSHEEALLDLNSKKQEFAQAQAQLAQKESQLTQLQEGYKQLENDQEMHKQTKQEMASELVKMRRAYEAEKEQKAQEHLAVVADLQVKIASLEHNLNSSSQVVNEHQDLLKTNHHLKQELVAATDRLEQAIDSKGQLEKKLTQIEQENYLQKQQFAKKLKEAALLYDSLEKHKIQVRELQHQLNSQNMQADSLKQSLDIQKQHSDEIKEFAQNRVHIAESQAKEWQQKFQQARLHSEELEARLSNLEKVKEDYERMRVAFSNLNQFIGGNAGLSMAPPTQGYDAIPNMKPVKESTPLFNAMPQGMSTNSNAYMQESPKTYSSAQVDRVSTQDLFSSKENLEKSSIKQDLFE
jgi:chromosome segregation ATPase